MKTMLLVDGNSILNRAFFGIRPLTASDGTFTQAVYGTVNILLHNIERVKPDYMACAFDLKAPTFRHKMFDGYKATRKGMPEELAMQLPFAKEAVRALGFRLLTLEGYEADDLLGTGSQFSLSDPDLTTYILTGDRDSLQLIRDNVHVLLATTGETVEMDREAFGNKYPGVTPEQFVDVKALMGDSSDNIPGVKGIGEKTALALIAEHGSLDGVYRDLPEAKLTPSVRKKLEEGKDDAYLSQTLARICVTAPTGLSLEDYSRLPMDRPAMAALLKRLELYQLLKRLGLDGEEATPAPEEAEQPPAPAETVTVTAKELSMLGGDHFGVSLTDGEISVFDGEKTYNCAYSDPKELKEFFALPKTFSVKDAKEIYKKLSAWEIPLGASLYDVTLAAYILSPTDSGYDLPRLSMTYLGKNAGGEAETVYLLTGPLEEKLLGTGQDKLNREIEQPLARVLAEMETVGFKVDTDRLKQFGEMLTEKCTEAQEAVYEAAGERFNISSPKQLGTVLFEKIGLPSAKKTKTGYATDAETLEKLRPYHPVIDRILEYRQYSKLKSTYADGLLKVADENGRIHSAFNQTVTATGRLSSSEPNLQNIPVRTELGREMRKFFVPKNEDYVLIDADYSQIELRLLALISGDERMTAAFRDGVDVHTATASQVFGIPVDEVTPELRKRAKAVNFGIMYGIGDYSLSQDLGIPKWEAAKYIESYLSNYPSIRGYLKETIGKARRDGYVTTLYGRRRAIPELASPKKAMQAFGERVAMNSPIQGTAADIIKEAMISVSNALSASGLDAHLILQVHDELIIESSRKDAARASEILRACMEKLTLPVPLTVELGIGDNWYECK